MTRQYLAAGEKPLFWIGSARKDFLDLPEAVQRSVSYSLGNAQFGGFPKDGKPWNGEGPGVVEIRDDHRRDTFRAIYTVRFAKAIYDLHVFQKKSKQGIKTDRGDQELVATRLREAERHYEARFAGID
jgi:phage-related protein